MNLLGRKLSLKKILKPGFMLMIPVFLSCETSEDIGVEYELDANTNVEFVEFTLPTTNVFIDSLRTDGENIVFAGNYNDEITGSVSTEGYFRFFYESGPMPRAEEFIDSAGVYQVPEDTLQVDSMVLILESESLLPIRGNVMQDLSVYELQDSLINSAIYLASLQANEGNIMGSFSQQINTATDTIFRFSLNQSFVDSFFETLSEIASDSNRSVVVEIFQSLGVIPNAGSESISAFDLSSDTSRLVVYTSPVESTATILDTTYVTTFELDSKHYSYIDRSSSTYGNLADREQFDLPSGETIVDPLYGISTVYSIAEIEQFFQANDNIIINNAVFDFSFRNETLRDTLQNNYAFFSRENGHFGPGIRSNSFTSVVMNDGAYLNGRSSPAVTFLNGDLDALTMNATLFLQTMYGNYRNNGSLEFEVFSFDPFPLDEFVLISFNDVTLQRSIFPEDGVKLRIYYTEVN